MVAARTRAGRPAAVARLPDEPGVYRFRDHRGRVLYIGRAANLRRRVSSYWRGLGDRRHLLRMVPLIDRVEAVACDSEHEAAWLERNLHERSLPSWNRAPGGQEVPVYVRLDQQPRSPGLGLVHVPTPRPGRRHFGPYLGGNRVRLAVSALLRVIPLAYAGDGLGGFQRDMARVRGVSRTDHDALVSAVSAVLERDSAARATLDGELERRRDAAARNLAFELAARVQAEIEAIDWILADQKVTLAEPCDFDLHGWAGGVLVHFEVRAGRLCAWRQRRCTGAVARPLVEATPPDWTSFVTRNAQLAARLVGTTQVSAD